MFDKLSDKLREECGIAATLNEEDAAYYTYLAVHALQHRGQEACGLIAFDQDQTHSIKGPGLVSDVIKPNFFSELKGRNAIAHVRYSTSGSDSANNIQPFSFRSQFGPLAIAHNGNLTNADEIRSTLEKEGSIFHSDIDSEVFIHLIAKSQKETLIEKIQHSLSKVEGAFSLAIVTKDTLYAARDPFGFRPLVIGKKGKAWYAVSETCALDLIGAEVVEEVPPGTICQIKDNQLQKFKIPIEPSRKIRRAFCSFEPIYFSRPDSKIFNLEVHEARKRIGIQLAKEHPCEVDTVIAIPDSGVPMAFGYGQEAEVPVEVGLVRSHYVGRTFIAPSQDAREFNVRLKLNPVKSVLRGKRVAVIDDSLVRGTTSMKIIRMLKEAGAKEIHFRIGSPPIKNPCYFGVDTPSRSKLMAANYSLKEMCEMIGADTLKFLSEDGLKKALEPDNPSQSSYCLACFNGNYPEKTRESLTL